MNVKRQAQMGRQAARSRELWASLVFRYASATTFNFKGKTVVNSCMDSLSLCSASHPISRADATTVSNYTTNAFSADNLKSAVAAMRAFKDPNGDPAMVRPDVLLIAPSIEQTVAQVINSTQIPGLANNDTNILNPTVAGTVWQGGLQVVVWDWLEPSSGSAPWFVIDRQVFRQNCRWYDRVPVRLERSEDFNSLTISVSNYGRWNHMLYDWRGIYGNFPA